MTTIDGLLGALVGAPRLPGARCVGRSKLFDPIETGEDPDDALERVEAAKHICGTCPVQTDCHEWVMSLPRSRRPPGVCGGVYRDHPSDNKKRKEAAA
ncbi:hypothetical protein HGK72_08130 [Mycolicibacterium fortuitum]|uniref:WhiB family transcriptional regulator n=1 Tax=Mycolicibacterium fortuitum TaxID=1766 RepID=UPI00148F9036|nr:hypothetical protein [Mycolicibacterium fortuitum]